jgi:hypothetical protein
LKGLNLNEDFFFLDPGLVHLHLPINGFHGWDVSYDIAFGKD